MEKKRRDLEYQWSEIDQRTSKFVASVAAAADEIEEAQRLRYRVFANELGAQLSDDGGAVDRDAFDAHCDHLIVRETDGGSIVGTYRLLDGTRAESAGGFYAEGEFHLPLLQALRSRIVEVGRACVAPEYRRGSVIRQLWAALTRHVLTHGYDFVVGCGSVSLACGAPVAASICRRMMTDHPSPSQWSARPFRPFPVWAFTHNLDVPVPALLAGYIHLGAHVCGPPAWDVEFNTADLLLWLPVREINHRYVRRLLRAA